jgi:hypothetical protein
MADRLIKITLYDYNGALLSNFSGIKYVFYNATSIISLGSPIASGTNETTDLNGLLSITITTTLAIGTIGWLIISNSDGTLTQNPPPRAFSGLVTLEDVGTTTTTAYLYDINGVLLIDSNGIILTSTE